MSIVYCFRDSDTGFSLYSPHVILCDTVYSVFGSVIKFVIFIKITHSKDFYNERFDWVCNTDLKVKFGGFGKVKSSQTSLFQIRGALFCE